MKYPDFEKFVSVSGLNIRQVKALQQILQRDDIVNLAVEALSVSKTVGTIFLPAVLHFLFPVRMK